MQGNNDETAVPTFLLIALVSPEIWCQETCRIGRDASFPRNDRYPHLIAINVSKPEIGKSYSSRHRRLNNHWFRETGKDGEMEMRSFHKTVIATACLAATFTGGALAQHTDWLTSMGGPEEQLKTLAAIQPGLGTVMIEYSNRYTNTYYAAKANNWDLASYMLKEQLEIQEVGEATRPERADALKAFEDAYIGPLDAAIKEKDFGKFEAAFNAGVKGCNGCHASQGFAYIEYALPDAPAAPLKFAQ